MSGMRMKKLFIEKVQRIGAGTITYALRYIVVDESADGTILNESENAEYQFNDSFSLNQAWLAADRIRILYDEGTVEIPLKEGKTE